MANAFIATLQYTSVLKDCEVTTKIFSYDNINTKHMILKPNECMKFDTERIFWV
jgi:hypothetical protein